MVVGRGLRAGAGCCPRRVAGSGAGQGAAGRARSERWDGVARAALNGSLWGWKAAIERSRERPAWRNRERIYGICTPRKAGAADRTRIVANWRNGMKSQEEAEGGAGGECAAACPCKQGRGQGKMSPGLLPAAISAAAPELRREPQKMLLTRQMQTEEVPVQPYRAHGAWANAGDSHLWAPTASWLEQAGLAALGPSSGACDVARNLWIFNSQRCGLSHFCIKLSRFNSRSCQRQRGGLPRKWQRRQGMRPQ